MADETTTIDPSDAPPAADAVALQERIAKLEQQNGDFLRHLAEFQNRNNELLQVMRRKEQELDQKLKFAHEKLAVDLLMALDNLDRAVDAAKKAGEKGPLTIGVAATQAQILDVLKRYGITPIDALGQPFDPNKHQAIQSRPADKGQKPDTVADVVQQGFMIHDRVLRPAAVIVAQ
ncbi:MAG TPA: nucleotide exchange factor GrpE [Gemmataceae bacterium]|jgi:molecular chaperone GrpE|nr:nucleotide exchange factor GrpE [Gemmataceae bacterium]